MTLQSPLSIQGVSKAFAGKVAVEDVSFTVKPGDYRISGPQRRRKDNDAAYGFRPD